MAVAQFIERSLPTPQIRISNPNISKILSTNCTFKKDENKEKEVRNGPSLKKSCPDVPKGVR